MDHIVDTSFRFSVENELLFIRYFICVYFAFYVHIICINLIMVFHITCRCDKPVSFVETSITENRKGGMFCYVYHLLNHKWQVQQFHTDWIMRCCNVRRNYFSCWTFVLCCTTPTHWQCEIPLNNVSLIVVKQLILLHFIGLM